MSEILKEIDPGTGLTLEDLIDAFISDPREAKRIKDHLTQRKPEPPKEDEADV